MRRQIGARLERVRQSENLAPAVERPREERDGAESPRLRAPRRRECPLEGIDEALYALDRSFEAVAKARSWRKSESTTTALHWTKRSSGSQQIGRAPPISVNSARDRAWNRSSKRVSPKRSCASAYMRLRCPRYMTFFRVTPSPS